MFKNTIKFALRIFKREKLFTTINIGGLVLGFYTSLILLGYVLFEFSYEKHIPNADTIYRVVTKRYQDKKEIYKGIRGPLRLGQVVVDEVPGVVASVRVYNEICLVRSGDYKLPSEKISWVDKDFFNVFKGVLLVGNPETVLDGPLKTVITESKALQLFGKENPVGKHIKVNEGMVFQVSGVVKDTPENTHFQYDYLCSLSTFVKYGWIQKDGNWGGNFNYTYLCLTPTSDKGKVSRALNKLAAVHFRPKKNKGRRLEFEVQPIKKIHLHSELPDELEGNGSMQQLNIMIVVGVIILLIVFVNFVNLSTALVLKRTKDTGVRKTFGASIKELRTQYFIESFLVNSLAFLIAAALVLLTYSFLESYFEVHFTFEIIKSPWFLFGLVVFLLFSIIVIGLYPATIVSSVNIIAAMKGKVTEGRLSTTFVKQFLLVIQFVASVFLFITAFVVYQQVEFMKHKDLGFKSDKVVTFQGPSTLNAGFRDFKARKIKYDKFKLFKERLQNNPNISEVSSCGYLLGQNSRRSLNTVTINDSGKEIQGVMKLRFMDEQFFPLHEIPFLAGQNFTKYEDREKNEVVINEKARKYLGFNSDEEVIGKTIKINWSNLNVIGVVKDFHARSLDEAILPMFFRNIHPWEFGYYIVKIDQGNIQTQIKFIQNLWNEIYPEDPFVPKFADIEFNQQYKTYEKFGSIFNALTILAIFIANLGLIAMISLNVAENLKQISLRRVIGSSRKAIFWIMAKDFIKIISIAVLIAVPIVWCFLNNWLQSFAYKIDLSFSYLLFGFAFIFIVAILNIMYFFIKILKVNPAIILRDE